MPSYQSKCGGDTISAATSRINTQGQGQSFTKSFFFSLKDPARASVLLRGDQKV
jgi:hypothetical protein